MEGKQISSGHILLFSLSALPFQDGSLQGEEQVRKKARRGYPSMTSACLGTGQDAG